VWVTAEEYPYRFILRLRNGEIFFFETALEISEFLNTIDRTSIWAVGFESFAGVMGFYLNFQDTVNGHGQYLYWPRLSSGKISDYNMPLYAFYPHLYALCDGVWFDQILNDRSLYSGGNQNPRNTLEFHNSESEFKVFFTLLEVNIQGTTWNFKHGFKYRMDDQLFHMITEFECVDQDFEDIGLAYEITTSPQSENTPYSPVKFGLENESETTVVSIQEAWQAGQYLDDYYSHVTIISENKEQFSFSFDDMELAGFTEKYLDLHDQRMPDGSVRKVLRAGMYGLGAYSAGTWVEIDPGTIYATDIYDLFMWSSTWVTTSSTLLIGDIPYHYPRYAFIAFDTGIDTAIDTVSNISFQLWFTSSNMEGNDGVGVRVYYVNGSTYGNGTGQARENSQSWTQGKSTSQDRVWTNPSTGQYTTGSTSKMDTILEYWADNRRNSENWVDFRLHGNYNGMGDNINAQDSQYSGTSHDPKLSFDYNLTYIIISGWVKEDGIGPVQGATIDLYQSGERVNGSITASSGYYSFWVDNSSLQHQLWAWDEDYKPECTNITPNTNQEVNFTLTLESAPNPNPPSGCRDPTSYSDDYYGWTSETEAYAKSGDYAVGNQSNPVQTVYYKNFNWNLPNGVTAEHIKVYIHWKSIIDDKIRMRIHWNESGGYSDWRILEKKSSWTLDITDFNETWTGSEITNESFMVEIEEITQNDCDLVLVDWVGTLVIYPPQITEFTAYKPYKGNEIHVATTIHNYFSTPKTVTGLKYKFYTDTYGDWNSPSSYGKWTPMYSENTSIPPYATVRIHDYLAIFFTDEGTNMTFAFNSGDYETLEVYAEGGGNWSDSYTPSTGEGEFEVEVQAGTHPVFVVHLRDSEFINEFEENVTEDTTYMDLLENHNFTWQDSTTTAKTLFGIDFHTLNFNWTPEENDLEFLYETQLNDDAGELLGCGVWVKRNGSVGTDYNNHGFDLVIGSSGEQNLVDSPLEIATCSAQMYGNYIVTMAGWELFPIGGIIYNGAQMQLAFLHEVFHTYDAEHTGPWYIMEPNLWLFGAWNLNSVTQTTVSNNDSHFDGPP
jgi:hypothetical protein